MEIPFSVQARRFFKTAQQQQLPKKTLFGALIWRNVLITNTSTADIPVTVYFPALETLKTSGNTPKVYI